MCPTAITPGETEILLDNWYNAIRLNHVSKAEQAKRRVEAKIDGMMEDQTFMISYTLLDYRHHILLKNLDEAEALLQKVEPFKENFDHSLTYYYYFFQGLYFWTIGQYHDALNFYKKAKKRLEHTKDDVEKAEFHYRIATVYYDLRKSLLSINHVNIAQGIFHKYQEFQNKDADCENLLGVNCIALKQFEDAEEHLLFALDLAQKSDDEELLLLIKYNLGYLYSEQNLSSIAIRYLKDVYKRQFYNPKTLFLLTREYLKTDQPKKAFPILEEGLRVCKEIENTEYFYHLNMIKALHSDHSIEELERIIMDGIKYFESEDLWYFVQEYSERLANIFYNTNNHEKASDYYHLGHVAKDKLFFREALK
ncbi:hypothetical protein EV207_12031 [Scopulibacillus darangshiensis]|uniref:Uncharacterized protein n=1 Tax=Scopulibacillus darangshiensis TaxID=442528 RepID=A0A4R2NVL9_9BACL|nr:tetratricopeptide repeat protein [Scopulibacillus darangshiensis]TCP25997.1 hypothetical protein EV207_12031 [Scopulibacillus darangshiensis]